MTDKKSAERKFIVFSSKFSVGIAEIDKQHKKIMDYINQIHAG